MSDRNIDELLFRFLTGRASSEEVATVLAWRGRSEANEAEFRELERTLSVAAEADRPRSASRAPRATDLLAARPARPPQRKSLATRSRWVRGLTSMNVLPWAAALLVAVGFSLWGRQFQPQDGPGVREVVTGAAETATIVLEEGTVVRLAPESRLRVNSDSDARSVALTGRGYFAVAEDPSHPFRVHTAAGEIEVLGTRFDLDATEADLRVTVVEGTVVLAVEDSEERLDAGQIGRVVRGTLLPAATVANPTESIDWLGNFLAFQSTPLREVVPEIERIYAVDVRIEDPRLVERTVSIYFADWTLPEVIEALCLIVQATCTIDQGVVHMK